MNEALLAAWKETVDEVDTIICGGDIALAGALKRERLARVRAMPGRKLLVRGNHDFGRNGRPADTGSDATWMTLVITGNLRRAHRVPAAPARRRATAGPGTARRPAAAGGDDGRGNPVAWTRSRPQGAEEVDRTDPGLEEGLRRREFPQHGTAPTRVVRGTVIGTIIVCARRLDRLGHLPNALGRGPPRRS